MKWEVVRESCLEGAKVEWELGSGGRCRMCFRQKG